MYNDNPIYNCCTPLRSGPHLCVILMVSMVVEAVKPEIEPSLDPAYMDSQMGLHQQEVQSTLKLVQLVVFRINDHENTSIHTNSPLLLWFLQICGCGRTDTTGHSDNILMVQSGESSPQKLGCNMIAT